MPVKKEHAFTLIELLVVIAIIALLLSIVVPSLKKVKDTAAMKLCGSNTRQIMLASAIYSNDNKEQVPRSTTRYNQEGDELGNKSSWICLPIINPSVSPTTTGDFVPAAAPIQATLEQRLIGIRHGTFSPCLGDTEVHNCPRGTRTQKTKGGYRSYSLNETVFHGGSGYESDKWGPSAKRNGEVKKTGGHITRLLDNFGYTTKVL